MSRLEDILMKTQITTLLCMFILVSIFSAFQPNPIASAREQAQSLHEREHPHQPLPQQPHPHQPGSLHPRQHPHAVSQTLLTSERLQS